MMQELGQAIHHIEEIEASIQAVKGREINVTLFPPQNPFRDVPIRRIDTDTYLLIARHIIGNQSPDQARIPGAEQPALLQELEQCCRGVRRIIAALDRELEEIVAQGHNQEHSARARRTLKDRNYLRAELQFYKDLSEALNYIPTRKTPEEQVEANQRARTWIENLNRRRGNRQG